MQIGILALQGAVEPHQLKLQELGVKPVLVRRAVHLGGLQGIILPGGESTTMIHLLKLNELWEPLKEFVSQKPTWGICAGAILLATEVSHPKQPSLGALDVAIERNAYGRQSESFISTVEPAPGSDWPTVEAVFIRAPRFRSLHGNTKALLQHEQEPVMVEDGQVLATTFHPELTSSNTVHRYFVAKARDYRG